MIDKHIQENIKGLRSFLEYWIKFHGLYRDIIRKDLITTVDEEHFLESKNLISNKYTELTNSFDFRYMPQNRLTDPVIEILALKNISAMSEERIKKIEGDWNGSYIFLNNILERMENKKRRLERFNPMGVFFKRLFERDKIL